MVDLRDFIGNGTAKGTKLNVFAKMLFLVNVGSGEFVDLGATQVVFKGRIDTVFYKGELSLTMKLNEDGSAEVSLNGSRTARATYTTVGNKLTLDARYGTRTQVISFARGGKGNMETFLEMKGSMDARVHLAPAASVA